MEENNTNPYGTNQDTNNQKTTKLDTSLTISCNTQK
jgi:hypothetical protein